MVDGGQVRSKLFNWLTLFRLWPALCAGALCAVGANISLSRWGVTTALETLRGCVTVMLMVGAANVMNDLCDTLPDSRNRPDRPLVCRAVSVSGAKRAVLLTAVLALLGAAVSMRSFVIVATIAGVSAAYNLYLKEKFLVGNTIISALAAAPLLYGSEIVGDVGENLWIALGIVVAFMFYFEVVKTVRDAAGDSLAGRRTAAIVLPPRILSRMLWMGPLVVGLLVLSASRASKWPLQFDMLMFGGVWLPMVAMSGIMSRGREPTDRHIRLFSVTWVPGICALLTLGNMR